MYAVRKHECNLQSTQQYTAFSPSRPEGVVCISDLMKITYFAELFINGKLPCHLFEEAFLFLLFHVVKELEISCYSF